MAAITFNRVTKRFADGTLAVDALSLDIPDGGFTVLVGPSGCGKSTALRLLAGLETLTDGEIRIGARLVNDVAPKDRDVAMVFQSYALYPHKTVRDNIGFPLKMQGVPSARVRERVEEVAAMLELSGQLDKRPRHLSGGQRQRVALCRAIVREPQAFLMDEPLSNLDAKLRVEMRAYIQKLQADYGITTLYVTHDQVEALTMGDRVAVMRGGQLEQLAAPQALYDEPANLFVATFIGSPAMNTLRGRVELQGDGPVVALGEQWLQAPKRMAAFAGREVVVGMRPEALSVSLNGASPGTVIEVPIRLTEALGSDVLLHGELPGAGVLAGDRVEVAREVGSVSAAPARVTARVPPGIRVGAGEPVRLAVEPEALHFFDLETETRL